MAAYKPRPKPKLVGTVQNKTSGLGRGQAAKPGPLQAKPKPNLAEKANKLRAKLGKSVTKEVRHIGPAPTAESDAGYLNRIDTADRKGAERLADLGNAERDIKHDFGIDDPTNPFSRANALKQTFLARGKAASAGLAAQGQGYSGAHERALARTRREEEEARAELRKSYDAAIGAVGAEKANVKWNTEEERNQAFEDWLARAPEAEVEVTDEEVGRAYDADEAAQINRALMPKTEAVPAGQAALLPGLKESAEAKARRKRQEKKAQEIIKRVGQKKAIEQGKVEKRGTVVGGSAGGSGFIRAKGTGPKPKAKPKNKGKGKH